MVIVTFVYISWEAKYNIILSFQVTWNMSLIFGSIY